MQSQKIVRDLKFQILKVEGLYPYSENKGADQLCGHRKADLRLCFRICKKPVILQRGSFDTGHSPISSSLNMSKKNVITYSFPY